MGNKVAPVKGMPDILPNQARGMRLLTEILAKIAESYGYQEIQTPILERAELFKRSVGESSDIVGKEMYSFADKKGQELVLRPEGTAAVVRAVISNGLDLRGNHLFKKGVRFWYAGPMFRYERPQQGRKRQFHQFGVEAFSVDTLSACCEYMAILWRCFDRVYDENASRPVLHINHLGDAQAREEYRHELRDWMRSVEYELDEDSRNRIEINPLRIWDSKVAKTQQLLEDAPKLYDFLNESARKELDDLKNFASSFEKLKVEINPNLVRGLDYYEGLVFEWVSDSLGAQDSVCGGGCYSSLIEQLGGPKTKACGFALGLDRLCLDIFRSERDHERLETDDSLFPMLCLNFTDDNSSLVWHLVEETLRRLEIQFFKKLVTKSEIPKGLKRFQWGYTRHSSKEGEGAETRRPWDIHSSRISKDMWGRVYVGEQFTRNVKLEFITYYCLKNGGFVRVSSTEFPWFTIDVDRGDLVRQSFGEENDKKVKNWFQKALLSDSNYEDLW